MKTQRDRAKVVFRYGLNFYEEESELLEEAREVMDSNGQSFRSFILKSIECYIKECKSKK